MTLSFLLTSLIVVASPGTGVLYTLAVALTRARAPARGRLRLHARDRAAHVAAMLGLAAVLHTSALAFAALKWCGVPICSTWPGRRCARPARWRSMRALARALEPAG